MSEKSKGSASLFRQRGFINSEDNETYPQHVTRYLIYLDYNSKANIIQVVHAYILDEKEIQTS